jgi:hypothetical protein
VNRGYFREGQEVRAFCGKRRCAPLASCALLRPELVAPPVRRRPGFATEDLGKLPAKSARSVSCDDCFFRKNMLCALALDEPCPTFRPDRPEGLRPPQQLRFVFRQERRRQAAWAFPSAQEQATLHT